MVSDGWRVRRVAPTLRDAALSLGGLAAPLGLLLALHVAPALDVEIEAPVQHFYIVSAVSVLALGFAVLLEEAGWRVYRPAVEALLPAVDRVRRRPRRVLRRGPLGGPDRLPGPDAGAAPIGILLYLLLWLLLPEQPHVETTLSDTVRAGANSMAADVRRMARELTPRKRQAQ